MASIDPIQEEQIGLPPAVLVDREAVPEWVSQRSRWSSFDRLLDKAPFLQQKRIDAWEALLDRHNWSLQPLIAPKLIGRGIFKASIGELDWIESQADDTLAFGGYGPNADGQLSKKTVRSPHGPLTVSRTIPNFECDITSIEVMHKAWRLDTGIPRCAFAIRARPTAFASTLGMDGCSCATRVVPITLRWPLTLLRS